MACTDRINLRYSSPRRDKRVADVAAKDCEKKSGQYPSAAFNKFILGPNYREDHTRNES